MRTIRRYHPYRFRLAASTVAALAAAVVVALPLAADAANTDTTSTMPLFAVWQPGTPLPTSVTPDPTNPTLQVATTAAYGYTWMAMPPASVEAALQPGDTIPLTTPDQATPDASGNVNLVALPTVNGTSCYLQLYKKNIGPNGITGANVGQAYTTVDGVWMNYDYRAGQSSTLGVGISESGYNLGFSEYTTDSVSSDLTQYFPLYKTKTFAWFQTWFLTDEYKQLCGTTSAFAGYVVRNYDYAGGWHVHNPSGAPNAPNCVPEPSGGGISLTSTKASTFSAGWGIYGTNFTAQTGYTTGSEVNMSWHGVSGKLCGTTGYPGQQSQTPGVLVGT